MNTDACDLLRQSNTDRRTATDALQNLFPELANAIHHLTEEVSGIYVIGHAVAFDEFTVPFLTQFGSQLSGVACYGTKAMKYPLPTGERLFDTTLSFTEPPTSNLDLVVLQVPVVSDPYEIVTMISMVSLQITTFPRTIVACLVAADGVEAAINEALAGFNLPAIEVVSLDQIAEGASELRDQLYDALDDRQLKIAPVMPIWIAERMWGPMPDELKEKRKNNQRSEILPSLNRQSDLANS